MQHDLTFTAVRQRFESRCRARGLAPRTIEFYGWRLNAFARFLAERQRVSLTDITPDDLRAFIELSAQTSASLAKQSYVTLQAVYKYLIREGSFTHSPMVQIERVKLPKKILPTFTLEEMTALLNTCKGNFVGIRDRCILLLLVDSMVRLDELCRITLQDINWGDGTILINGKGSKQRETPFGEVTRAALNYYLDQRGIIPYNETLFLNVYSEPMHRRAVQTMIRNRGTQAKIQGVRCSPHTFRHTGAVMYIRRGGDLFSLERILGHSDISTTRIYVDLSNADVVHKHNQFSPGDQFAAVAPKRGRTRRK